jgi:hypothetical protein
MTTNVHPPLKGRFSRTIAAIMVTTAMIALSLTLWREATGLAFLISIAGVTMIPFALVQRARTRSRPLAQPEVFFLTLSLLTIIPAVTGIVLVAASLVIRSQAF